MSRKVLSVGASPSEAATNQNEGKLQENGTVYDDKTLIAIQRGEIEKYRQESELARLDGAGILGFGEVTTVGEKYIIVKTDGAVFCKGTYVSLKLEQSPLARTSSSGPPNERCNSRQPPGGEDVRCELRAGHGVIHLSGEYCWPMARKCVVCQKPAPDEADFCSTKCEDIARRETEIEKSYPASSSGQGSMPDKL